jgi:hypothetical protein
MNLVKDLEQGRIADSLLAEGQEPRRVSLDELCARLSSRGAAGMATAHIWSLGEVQEEAGRTAERAADSRLVYKVRELEVPVLVVAVGKRERNAGYRQAAQR